MDRDALLKQLTILDFMAVDLQLYLDTHPTDREAIHHYNTVVYNADKVRAMYEKAFGPLTSFRSCSNNDKFCWIDDPWPWTPEANFTLSGEAR